MTPMTPAADGGRSPSHEYIATPTPDVFFFEHQGATAAVGLALSSDGFFISLSNSNLTLVKLSCDVLHNFGINTLIGRTLNFRIIKIQNQICETPTKFGQVSAQVSTKIAEVWRCCLRIVKNRKIRDEIVLNC